MTISQRQFKLLNAMEIPLWVSKQSQTVNAEPSSQAKNTASKLEETISLTTLRENQLFSDILQTLAVPSVDVTLKNNVLTLGRINWQFSQDNTLSFEQNLLSTPSIDQLEKSPQLKRQLWQLMIDKELICH